MGSLKSPDRTRTTAVCHARPRPTILMNIITFMTKGKLMPTYFRERWDLRNLQTERQPQRPKKAGNRPAKEISPLFMQIICVSVFCKLACICTGCTLVVFESLVKQGSYSILASTGCPKKRYFPNCWTWHSLWMPA